MGVDRSVTHKHLQFLLTKGLLRSYDPSVDDIDYSKSVEITPSGAEHYYWGVNDFDYIYAMLEVTPITDKVFFQELTKSYYVFKQRFEMILKFLDYLENEDTTYCKIPNHISYEGQKHIHARFQWQRKILERRIERLSA